MNKEKIFFCFVTFYIHINLFCTSFVQYTLSHGRFGDQILAYAKAQYIAYKNGIPLLYTPFHGSDLIQLAHAKLPYAYCDTTKYFKEIIVNNDTIINKEKQHTLYSVSLSTKHKDITNLDSIAIYALQDKAYGEIVKKMLTPIVHVHAIEWPKDCVTVSLHVRKPSGHDTKLTSKQLYNADDYKNIEPTPIEKKGTMPSDKRYPHKFPPDQYYIDQINHLPEIFPDQHLYVYLFTDYNDPEELVSLYKPYIKNKNVTLTCHNKEQQTYMSFIDDYYNMAQTNCLIRPSSNFSRAVQLLGNHEIIIYPKKAEWREDAVIVSTVCILKIDILSNLFKSDYHKTI